MKIYHSILIVIFCAQLPLTAVAPQREKKQGLFYKALQCGKIAGGIVTLYVGAMAFAPGLSQKDFRELVQQKNPALTLQEINPNTKRSMQTKVIKKNYFRVQ